MTKRILLGVLLGAMFLPSALARADNPRLVATVGRNDTFSISLLLLQTTAIAYSSVSR